MTTAIDLITRSLKDLGILDAIEVPSADQSADGLVYLNDLLESWSNEGLTVYTQTQSTLTLTGALSYTVGASGTFNTARPVVPSSAFYSSGGIDYPVDIVTLEQYNSIPYKSDTGGIPLYIAFNTAVPQSTMYIYPAPSTGTLTLVSQKPLTAMTALTTVLAFPNGYERALRLALGVEMMPTYGVQNQQIMAMADKAKKDIKRINYRPSTLDVNVPAGRSYNNGGYPRILWG
jgi:hypothetical protein